MFKKGRISFLCPLTVHKNVQLDYDRINDYFPQGNQRKMLLVNPMALMRDLYRSHH